MESLREKKRRVSQVHDNEEGLDEAVRERALRELSASLHKELDQARHLHRRASTDLRMDLMNGLEAAAAAGGSGGGGGPAPSRQASGIVAPRGSLAMPSDAGNQTDGAVSAEALGEVGPVRDDEDCVTLELRNGECITLRPVGGPGGAGAAPGICSAPVRPREFLQLRCSGARLYLET